MRGFFLMPILMPKDYIFDKGKKVKDNVVIDCIHYALSVIIHRRDK